MDRKHERSADKTTMTVSLPKSLLDRIDRLRKTENRTRSNWVVTELDSLTAAKLNTPKLFSEAGEPINVAGADSPSSASARTTPAALPEFQADPHLNEDAPAKHVRYSARKKGS